MQSSTENVRAERPQERPVNRPSVFLRVFFNHPPPFPSPLKGGGKGRGVIKKHSQKNGRTVYGPLLRAFCSYIFCRALH